MKWSKMTETIDQVVQSSSLLLEKSGKGLYNLCVGTCEGLLRGVYTPFFLMPNAKNFVEVVEKYWDKPSFIGSLGLIYGGAFSAVVIQLSLLKISSTEGNLPEYLGILTGTNLLGCIYDYWQRGRK